MVLALLLFSNDDLVFDCVTGITVAPGYFISARAAQHPGNDARRAARWALMCAEEQAHGLLVRERTRCKECGGGWRRS